MFTRRPGGLPSVIRMLNLGPISSTDEDQMVCIESMNMLLLKCYKKRQLSELRQVCCYYGQDVQ